MVKNKVIVLGYNKLSGWGLIGIFSKSEAERFKREIKEKRRKYETFEDKYAFARVTTEI